jgi:chain length determinant protein EpsF
MTFRQLIVILRARWRIASGILTAVLLAAVVICVISPKQYTATAAVVVDPKADPIAGVVNPQQLSTGYLATQIDVLNSERVARKVVTLLHLDQSQQFRESWVSSTNGQGDFISWVAHILQKHVFVMPSHESNVINISVKWPERNDAANLANAYAQAYLDTAIDLKVEPAKQYTQWFDQRSQELRADLEAKQARLSEFQTKTGITATDEHFDIESARLSELSSQLTATEVHRQESQSREQRINGDNEGLPEVLQSPVIGELKADLAAAEAKQKDVATKLGVNHPEYQTIAAQVTALRARIALEISKVTTSLGNLTRTDVQRESELRAALETQRKHVLELKQRRDELDVLKNDVVTAQRNLDATTERLAQHSLESQIQQTNVIPLTTATAPAFPSSPNYKLSLIIGFIVGVILGIGVALLLETLNPRVRSDQDLGRLLSVPLLGRIRASGPLLEYNHPAFAPALGGPQDSSDRPVTSP